MADTPEDFNEEPIKTDTQAVPKMTADGELVSETKLPTESEDLATRYKEAVIPELALIQAPLDSDGNPITEESVRKPMSDFEKKMLYMKIRDMDDLPTPNEHVSKIVRLLQSPEVKIHEVVDIIEHDESLVVQIIKMINSGFFSMRATISNVEQAVNLLGILQIKKLIYSASIMDLFSQEMKEEFAHTYSASTLMTTIMEQFNIPAASNLPLTMLVHDIGKVVLNRFAPKKCQLARAYAEQIQIPLNWGERHVLGLDHAEITDIMLRKWDMTDDIIHPIKNHHTKGIPDDYVLETALVQFVDYIDSKARNKITNDLNKHIMAAAGLEFTEDDIYGWIIYQREFIENSEEI